ncbi:hypothetical protein CEXT_518111 [Caerostris extrusa]|uniref:Uncharacterized protein n=1 Tax=Caerostris extrusa TaxID=172846 RepID=A0AAV4SKH6_CAEEX|nr:hypothetical protein CEXT_518111 [Caerostris extrusa]
MAVSHPSVDPINLWDQMTFKARAAGGVGVDALPWQIPNSLKNEVADVRKEKEKVDDSARPSSGSLNYDIQIYKPVGPMGPYKSVGPMGPYKSVGSNVFKARGAGVGGCRGPPLGIHSKLK